MLDELGPTFVKFGQLLSTRPDVVPPGHHRRAARPAGRRAPVPVRRRREDDSRGARPADRAAVHRVRRAAARGGVDRAGASRDAAERPPRRRQGAAAERAAADRGRPRADVPGGAAREGAHPRARLHRRERDRRRVRALDPAGARLPPRGAQRRRLPQELRRPPARRGAARLLDVHAVEGADARVPRGRAARRPRARPVVARAAPPARVPDRRDVDDDDLPPRVLPRRPAPGEHPRPVARADRARRLRPGREAHRRRHVEADAALHRRRVGEHRAAAEAARRPRRALPEGARGGVRRRAARAVLPLLRREPPGDRPDPGDPRGVRADLLDEPAAADAVRDARQGDRDARLGRGRALSGLQRLRGGEAVRARPDARALHAAADGARARGARAGS